MSVSTFGGQWAAALRLTCNHDTQPSMKAFNTKPKFEPRQFKASPVWYVLVTWGDRPLEQVGGFPDEAEAQEWIARSSASWLNERLDGPNFD